MAGADFKVYNARVTFRNVPMHKLSKYRFKDVDAVATEFKKIADVSECLIIQTASRVEIFIVTNLDVAGGDLLTIGKIKGIWAEKSEVDEWEADHFDQTMEVYVNRDVYENLLRLSMGLQSVVVGKMEILDEIKAAAAKAKEAGDSGRVLNKLFDTVIRVATKIRGETGMGSNWKSIGDVAVRLADDNAGIDGKKKILILGTGEVAARVAKSLNRREVGFSVASMQIERAQGFAELLGGEPVDFKDVIASFDRYDIVFVATTADYFILQYDQIRRQMESKKTGTMILDISDPRAISEDVSVSSGVKLMFRDQVEERYAEIQKEVQAKIPAVEKAIVKEVPILEATMNRVHADAKSVDVFSKVDQLREKELKKALEELGDLDEEKRRVIEQLTKSVVENIVSVPSREGKGEES